MAALMDMLTVASAVERMDNMMDTWMVFLLVA